MTRAASFSSALTHFFMVAAERSRIGTVIAGMKKNTVRPLLREKHGMIPIKSKAAPDIYRQHKGSAR